MLEMGVKTSLAITHCLRVVLFQERLFHPAIHQEITGHEMECVTTNMENRFITGCIPVKKGSGA